MTTLNLGDHMSDDGQGIARDPDLRALRGLTYDQLLIWISNNVSTGDANLDRAIGAGVKAAWYLARRTRKE
jgi:hypothetical protein